MMDRRALLLCLLAGGCGFRPLYGGGTQQLAAQVQFDPVPGRVGYWFTDRLRSSLPGHQPANWRLQVTLLDSDQGLAVRRNDAVTRYNYRLDVTLKLYPINGTEPILTDRFEVVTAYNATASQFATLISERDARQLAAEEAADRTMMRVLAFLSARA